MKETQAQVAMFTAMLGLLLQPIGGDLVVLERPDFYEVKGSSAEELRRAMNLLGPRDDKGERRDASTHWTVRWDYRHRAVAGVCYLTSFTTTLTVDTILPKWDGEGAVPALQERWDDFLLALEEHEGGHADIGRRAAREIQERGSALSSARSCPALVDAIKSTSKVLLARHRKEDAEYDRRTDHGRSQGARFP